MSDQLRMPLPEQPEERPRDAVDAIAVPGWLPPILEIVRRDARVSMGDQRAVAQLCYLYGGEQAGRWVEEADTPTYTAALRALGAVVRGGSARSEGDTR